MSVAIPSIYHIPKHLAGEISSDDFLNFQYFCKGQPSLLAHLIDSPIRLNCDCILSFAVQSSTSLSQSPSSLQSNYLRFNPPRGRKIWLNQLKTPHILRVLIF
jgi:hypothetical protein